MKPTPQQQQIIDDEGNCVVIAAPGSGKTFVLSQKLRCILSESIPFKGAIAISFTNEASSELKHRTLAGSIDPKGSYFGTIDSFCFIEIIAPFGKHIFGYPKSEFEVIQMDQLSEERKAKIEELPPVESYDDLEKGHIEILKQLYLEGKILLELFGVLANYVFDHSPACREYILARYTHIVVDEYQDSGYEQHLLFTKIVGLGLTGMAVGDVHQAIFGFAKKDKRHLMSLKGDEAFSLHPLLVNFRCHSSISNYAKKFISSNVTGFAPKYTDTDENRVFEKYVEGNEAAICAWIEQAIHHFSPIYGVEARREIGILVNSGKKAQMIADGLTMPSRFFKSTPIDNDVSLWSGVFRRILNYVFDPEDTAHSVVDTFLDMHTDERITRRCVGAVRKVKAFIEGLGSINALFAEGSNAEPLINLFAHAAEYIYPNKNSVKARKALLAVLTDKQNLESYFPIKDDEIRVMTFHKSKGLEFDIVFHLDLYSFILPRMSKVNGRWDFTNIDQCVNIHFVALTRAKHACILVHSSKRTNWQDQIKDGRPSEFLVHPNLKELHQMRTPSPV